MNYHIENSYLIRSKKEQLLIIEDMPEKFFEKRTKISYLREWSAHNWLYDHGLFREHTKSVDLNTDEPWWRRFCYFFISLLYRE